MIAISARKMGHWEKKHKTGENSMVRTTIEREGERERESAETAETEDEEDIGL